MPAPSLEDPVPRRGFRWRPTLWAAALWLLIVGPDAVSNLSGVLPPLEFVLGLLVLAILALIVLVRFGVALFDRDWGTVKSWALAVAIFLLATEAILYFRSPILITIA